MLPRILVVDDEDSIRQLVCQRLRNLGLTDLRQAESGREAIALLEAGHKYDLIISDQCMANGTGIDIFRYLRERENRCFFVFYTGSPISLDFSERWFLGVVEKADLKGLENVILGAICGVPAGFVQ